MDLSLPENRGNLGEIIIELSRRGHIIYIEINDETKFLHLAGQQYKKLINKRLNYSVNSCGYPNFLGLDAYNKWHTKKVG